MMHLEVLVMSLVVGAMNNPPSPVSAPLQYHTSPAVPVLDLTPLVISPILLLF